MSDRFERAIALIDEENSRDPNHDQSIPRELLYSQRLTDWVLRLNPNASEPLRLAARSQHIARWKIPRKSYPEGRAGYLRWRNDLKCLHADLTGEILKRAGYDNATIDYVRSLNLKRDLTTNPDVQTLEDALCLVFLQFQFAELAAKLPADKVLNALRKSWNKMSDNGRRAALSLPFSDTERSLLTQAFSADQGVS